MGLKVECRSCLTSIGRDYQKYRFWERYFVIFGFWAMLFLF